MNFKDGGAKSEPAVQPGYPGCPPVLYYSRRTNNGFRDPTAWYSPAL